MNWKDPVAVSVFRSRSKKLRRLNRYLVNVPTELAKKVMINELRRFRKARR